ncbi:MAG: DUF262 domain-containing protein [Anaerolineaceae bacterium]|nr:DUF262 domain-containing protein [Anaerolineaceae bacterium]
MKLKNILEQIDQGVLALPQFQRGFVWKRWQVRNLMESLYREYPIGSMLVWQTKTKKIEVKGQQDLPLGIHELLLDGQQRLTSLYGIVRGKKPDFSNAEPSAFLNLYFNVETEEFEFYGPTKMKHNPRWVSVTDVMQKDLGDVIKPFMNDPDLADYISRIARITGILERNFHIETMIDRRMSMDVVVDIFNQVNSGGTKLSKGDLALAKICADWSEARETMQARLDTLSDNGHYFNLDWLLRCVNGLVTGHADFSELDRQNVTVAQVQDGLARAEKHVDSSLTILASRLGLDHSYVQGSPNALVAMARFFDRHGAFLDHSTLDKLCYWYVHAMLWQRYSGPVETRIRQDIMAVDEGGDPVDNLIRRLQDDNRRDLRVLEQDLTAANRGGRFYAMLYMLTRVNGARDFCKGIELKKFLLGGGNQLELHHIFPKSQLYNHGDFGREEVNAIANFAFLTKDCNLQISATLPEDYLPQYNAMHPGVLASHWIPEDPHLWKIDNYREFLAERRKLLANAANSFLDQLYRGAMPETEAPVSTVESSAAPRPISIASDEEEAALLRVMDWMKERGLPSGELGYELPLADNGDVIVLDLAWPNGIQEGLSRKVALLIDETPETLAIVNHADYEYFTDVDELKRHVQRDILGEPA